MKPLYCWIVELPCELKRKMKNIVPPKIGQPLLLDINVLHIETNPKAIMKMETIPWNVKLPLKNSNESGK